MSEYNKPLPEATVDDKNFWDAAKRRELSLPKCVKCGEVRHPSPICPKCLSMEPAEWIKLSGKGKVYSWVIMYQRYHPGFAADLPYNVAIVELNEGPRLLTNVVGCKNEDIRIGMDVEVVFDDVTPEITLPKFKPIV